jgi:hypothetical protein
MRSYRILKIELEKRVMDAKQELGMQVFQVETTISFVERKMKRVVKLGLELTTLRK